MDAERSEQSLRVSTTIALTEAGTPDVQSRLVALGRVSLDAEKLDSAGLMPPSRATPRQRTPITPMTHASFVRKVNDLLRIMSMRRRLRGNHATSHDKRAERASLRRRDRLESPGKPCLEANEKKAGMHSALHFLTVAKKPQSSEKACRTGYGVTKRETSPRGNRLQALPGRGPAGPFSDTIFRCQSVEVLGEIEDGPRRALRRRKPWDQNLADF